MSHHKQKGGEIREMTHASIFSDLNSVRRAKKTYPEFYIFLCKQFTKGRGDEKEHFVHHKVPHS